MFQSPDSGDAAAGAFRVKISAHGMHIKSTIDDDLFSHIGVVFINIPTQTSTSGVGQNRNVRIEGAGFAKGFHGFPDFNTLMDTTDAYDVI